MILPVQSCDAKQCRVHWFSQVYELFAVAVDWEAAYATWALTTLPFSSRRQYKVQWYNKQEYLIVVQHSPNLRLSPGGWAKHSGGLAVLHGILPRSMKKTWLYSTVLVPYGQVFLFAIRDVAPSLSLKFKPDTRQAPTWCSCDRTRQAPGTRPRKLSMAAKGKRGPWRGSGFQGFSVSGFQGSQRGGSSR